MGDGKGFFWFEVEGGGWMVGMWGWVGWMDGWAEEVKMMEKRRRVHKIVHVHDFLCFHLMATRTVVRRCWCICRLGNQREMGLYAADDRYFH